MILPPFSAAVSIKLCLLSVDLPGATFSAQAFLARLDSRYPFSFLILPTLEMSILVASLATSSLGYYDSPSLAHHPATDTPAGMALSSET
ncbi:hypothetical protein NITLEN_40179 [Nitrospira lenta]|uniref:Uncharacterized protein n=1 Tax=Nitrospira lenta TaxID=1436998 RepID=A0A330L7M4_9BACT|nr:hypothetical protein NITLEN_40179 [Nitrospira lenta]